MHEQPLRNTALIVLGMHRSGTSALTGLLSEAGANVGTSLMPASHDYNPKGFWESSDIVTVHERLLEALGSSWSDERKLPDHWWQLPKTAPFRAELITILRRNFSDKSIWAVKDPRICRLLPLWITLLDELEVSVNFIICLRNPIEVAQSIQRRDGIPLERACLLWLTHLQESEYWSRGRPRIIIQYSELLADWRIALKQISEHFLLPLQPADQACSRIDSFIEPALRHHSENSDHPAMDTASINISAQVYALAKTNSADDLQEIFEKFHGEIDVILKQVTPWSSEIHALNDKISRLVLEAATAENLRAETTRIKSTLSWKITKPLRLIANLPRIIVNRE